MCGAEVLGIISSVITIFDAAIQLNNVIKDEAGLPPSFKTVAAKLPLMAKLLDDAERYSGTTCFNLYPSGCGCNLS